MAYITTNVESELYSSYRFLKEWKMVTDVDNRSSVKVQTKATSEAT